MNVQIFLLISFTLSFSSFFSNAMSDIEKYNYISNSSTLKEMLQKQQESRYDNLEKKLAITPSQHSQTLKEINTFQISVRFQNGGTSCGAHGLCNIKAIGTIIKNNENLSQDLIQKLAKKTFDDLFSKDEETMNQLETDDNRVQLDQAEPLKEGQEKQNIVYFADKLDLENLYFIRPSDNNLVPIENSGSCTKTPLGDFNEALKAINTYSKACLHLLLCKSGHWTTISAIKYNEPNVFFIYTDSLNNSLRHQNQTLSIISYLHSQIQKQPIHYGINSRKLTSLYAEIKEKEIEAGEIEACKVAKEEAEKYLYANSSWTEFTLNKILYWIK